ncbi:MAG: hypothetical protein U0165_17210 [Polyangiaceae bacterium]
MASRFYPWPITLYLLAPGLLGCAHHKVTPPKLADIDNSPRISCVIPPPCRNVRPAQDASETTIDALPTSTVALEKVDESQRQEAKALFQNATVLLSQERHSAPEALDLLLRAWRVFPTYKLTLPIAEAAYVVERFGLALDARAHFLAEAKPNERQRMSPALQSLEKELALVHIVGVEPGSSIQDIRTAEPSPHELNYPITSTRSLLRVKPGIHRFRGPQSTHVELTIHSGDDVVVDLTPTLPACVH